jgi:uncharacterized membrane protein YphA (DoxX/SURF4 family)
MNAFIWILQVALAAMFLMAGAMKMMQPKDKIQENMAWVEDFDGSHIRAIGLLEVLAAIGLVLPGLFNVIPGVTPWAALGLVLLMIGAAVVHARRQEWPYLGLNVMLLILAAIVVWGRFGDYAF